MNQLPIEDVYLRKSITIPNSPQQIRREKGARKIGEKGIPILTTILFSFSSQLSMSFQFDREYRRKLKEALNQKIPLSVKVIR